MLSEEIREFIETVKQTKTIGCILVPEQDLEKLLINFQQADQIIGQVPQEGRATYHVISDNAAWPKLQAPAVLIVTEESYSVAPAFREKIRDKAGYFLNAQSR